MPSLIARVISGYRLLKPEHASEEVWVHTIHFGKPFTYVKPEPHLNCIMTDLLLQVDNCMTSLPSDITSLVVNHDYHVNRYQLMLSCWHSESQARLSFTQLKYSFKNIIAASSPDIMANYIAIQPNKSKPVGGRNWKQPYYSVALSWSQLLCNRELIIFILCDYSSNYLCVTNTFMNYSRVLCIVTDEGSQRLPKCLKLWWIFLACVNELNYVHVF